MKHQIPFRSNCTRSYLNHRTEEETNSASVALQWHRDGDRVQVSTINPKGSLRASSVIGGAKVETERARFDRVEGRERCEAIAKEVNAYAEGDMYRCPECGEVVEMPEGVGDKFKCYHCHEINDLNAYEQLSVYDYLDDVLDIEYRIDGNKDYRSCEICIGWGGPNIYIDTADAHVKLYWGSTREQYPIHYETRDEIDAWAEEMWGCL